MGIGVLGGDLHCLVDVVGFNKEEGANALPGWEVWSLCYHRLALDIAGTIRGADALPGLGIGKTAKEYQFAGLFPRFIVGLAGSGERLHLAGDKALVIFGS